MDISAFQELYPFKSNYFDLDGLRYHYLDEGPREAQALVMLHGNPTWSFYYRTLIPALTKAYRVIVPDHIGCGLSDKPQNYTYTLDQHIHNLERLLSSLGIKTLSLVLHDWGGAIGMGYAVRFHEYVRQFVILNTAAFSVPVMPLRIEICRVPFIGEMIVRGCNGFAKAALRFATSQPQRFTPQVKSGYLAPYNSWKNRIAVHRFVKDIPMNARHPSWGTLKRIEQELPRFRNHPMLILWGEDDFCFTVDDVLPEWQIRFPQAETHLLKNAGHYVVEDAHERLLPLIEEFLQNKEFPHRRQGSSLIRHED
ncbi:alpha/beta hydrolase [candidate division KSB3 bacterium]|uniref:Alpha/beta hydrolase n=1 Tax=candidate division KSB3 bacterium TaxID=2044937 RepID=A0A2G6E3X8_9BACT|nr:MAG: alpha/beta hydrolase [candidate division KSB3 bacterium]PIE28928.1 MAG: alpha/beta hydrolase [candidate division KSB3 bacterium]